MLHLGLSSPLYSWQAVPLPPPGQGLGAFTKQAGKCLLPELPGCHCDLLLPPSPHCSRLPPQWPHGFLSKLRVFWCTRVWILLAAVGVVREEEKMLCFREREPGGMILWLENPQQHPMMPEEESWRDGSGWVVTEGVSGVEGTIGISSLFC